MRENKVKYNKSLYLDAKHGRLERIFSIINGSNEHEMASQAFLWLLVSYDFGHQNATQYIETLTEASSLRFDDNGNTKASVHLNLGLWYLGNIIKHPKKLLMARRHLRIAFEKYNFAELINSHSKDIAFDDIILSLEPEAAQEWKNSLDWAADPFRKVTRQLQRLKRLHQIKSVPTIIIESESNALLKEVKYLVEVVLEKTRTG